MSRPEAFDRGVRAVVLLLAITAASPLSGAEPGRFAPLNSPGGPVVDWIIENTDGLLVGSNDRVLSATVSDRPVFRERYTLEGEVTSAIALGRSLLVVRDETRVTLFDSAAETTLDLRLDPPARERLTPAALGDVLLLAEDGYGLRFLALTWNHHHGAPEITPVARLTLNDTFTAITVRGRTAFVATASRRLYEIDATVLNSPRVVRQTFMDSEVFALASGGDRVLALGTDGLTIYRATAHDIVVEERVAEIRGHAMQLNGRVLYVASPEGVQAWRDRGAGTQTHSVTVGNNYFSPATLAIDVNDSVQWTNAALGGLHNVESCVPEINGCNGETADETFTSGPVAGPPWTYTHPFNELGTNPYVCIAHLPFMTGLIQTGLNGRFRVPIDDIGIPMAVSKASTGGESLRIDASFAGPAGSHTLVWGRGADRSVHGSLCPESSFDWADTPDPTVDGSNVVWWLIVPTVCR